jgi:hypothetical protein
MSAPRAATLITSARNASLTDLVAILNTHADRARDVIVNPSMIRFEGGLIRLDAPGLADARMGADYRPMATFDSGLAERLPLRRDYITWMREQRPDIFAATLNALFHGSDGPEGTFPADDRRFMLRLFAGDPGQPGMARAFVSNKYQPLDSITVVMTALQILQDREIRKALGLPADHDITDGDRQMFAEMNPGGMAAIPGSPEIRNCNLTEDTLDLQITVPGIAAVSKLADGYRNPFRADGASRAVNWAPPGARPKRGQHVWAGVRIRTNEVGFGALTVTPMALYCVCDNGQVVPQLAHKAVHAGVRLEDEGIIRWSDATRTKAKELVLAKLTDAFDTFLSEDFLAGRLLPLIEEGIETPVADPAATIEVVARKCSFNDVQQANLLQCFTLGGRADVGGVVAAVTAAAQMQADPADALDMEYKAMIAKEAALAHARA